MKLSTIIVMVAVLIVLGVVYIVTSRPEPPEPVEAQYFVWDVEMDELKEMKISLPPRDMSESWVIHEDKYWYFDEPNGPKVDMQRWGGGIPLLLSGPGANRRITGEATEEQLESYGLLDPAMTIDIVLVNDEEIHIEVGDSTIGRDTYYIRLVDSKNVYTVDYTWFQVLERLVTEPPYPKPEAE